MSSSKIRITFRQIYKKTNEIYFNEDYRNIIQVIEYYLGHLLVNIVSRSQSVKENSIS